MREFKEFQETKEQNKENLEARLEERTQELLNKADALIESSAELLAEDSVLTKEEIIERVQEDTLKELGEGYTKEDLGPAGTDAKAYTPSFGAWSTYDSDITYKMSELTRDAKNGHREAVKNDLKEIKELEKKRERDLEKKQMEKLIKQAEQQK